MNLLKHGFNYDEELNRLCGTPLPSDTFKYVLKSRMISPNKRSMIIDSLAYDDLICDNYRPRGGKWVKMSKDEAKEYDNDPDIKKIFAPVMNDSSGDSDNPDDIDEFEYDENGYAIFPF